MKESEAKTKWCPCVRFYNPNRYHTPENRWEGGSMDKCIGSDCMMWVKTSEPPITGSPHGDCGLKGNVK